MALPRIATLPAVTKKFVGRVRAIRSFDDKAFAIPTNKTSILVFHGPGGEGKTALRRILLNRLGENGDRSLGFLKPSCLDLAEYSESPVRLLVRIRNGFAESGIVFPRFDLAFAIFWEAAHSDEALPPLTKSWLHRIGTVKDIAGEGLTQIAKDFLSSSEMHELVGEVAANIPGVGFLVRNISKWLIDRGRTSYLLRAKPELALLYAEESLKPAYELTELLPIMLSSDLNEHITRHPTDRFVLFADEYETAFKQAGIGLSSQNHPIDTYLQRIGSESNGLLMVFFSRERLNWDLAWSPELNDSQHLLEGLSKDEARTFLQGASIVEPEVQDSIINSSKESDKLSCLYYPLMLDLQVERWRLIRAGGGSPCALDFELDGSDFTTRRKSLIGKLLRGYELSTQQTLERVAFTDIFDKRTVSFIISEFRTAFPEGCIDSLLALSLFTKIESGLYRFHKVVAETIRSEWNNEDRRQLEFLLFSNYNQRLQQLAKSRDINLFAILTEEASRLRFSTRRPNYAQWLTLPISILMTAAKYDEAAAILTRAYDRITSEYGSNHPELTVTCNNLAHALRSLGKFNESHESYLKALDLAIGLYGQESVETLFARIAIAGILVSLNRLPEAEYQYNEVFRSELNNTMPSEAKATLSNDYGQLLEAQGRFAEAETQYKHALAIRRQNIPEDFDGIATNLNNLGVIQMELGRIPDARRSLHESLNLRRTHLITDQPAIAGILANLAALEELAGSFAIAFSLCEEATKILQVVLGSRHPKIALLHNTVGNIVSKQGNIQLAASHFSKAYDIASEVYPPSHPAVTTCLANLAGAKRALGENGEALEMYEKLVRDMRLDSKLNKGDLASLLNSYGDFQREVGNIDVALTLLNESLNLRQELYGASHPILAATINNIGLAFEKKEDFSQALSAYHRAMTISSSALGDNHPDVAICLNNMAGLSLRLGRISDAESFAQASLNIRVKKLGRAHFYTVGTAALLASVYVTKGDMSAVARLLANFPTISVIRSSHGTSISIKNS